MTAIDSLTHAFTPDPGFSWIFPDADRRPDHLRHLFAGSMRHCERVGGVASIEQGRGVGLWSERGAMHITLWQAFRAGMLALPARIGLANMRRLDAAEREGLGLIERAVDGPFAYLMALAVNPEAHGRGLGRRTVALVEQQARDAGHRTLTLRTENSRNVGLYQHLGFQLLASETVPTSGLTVHAMAKSI